MAKKRKSTSSAKKPTYAPLVASSNSSEKKANGIAEHIKEVAHFEGVWAAYCYGVLAWFNVLYGGLAYVLIMVVERLFGFFRLNTQALYGFDFLCYWTSRVASLLTNNPAVVADSIDDLSKTSFETLEDAIFVLYLVFGYFVFKHFLGKVVKFSKLAELQEKYDVAPSALFDPHDERITSVQKRKDAREFLKNDWSLKQVDTGIARYEFRVFRYTIMMLLMVLAQGPYLAYGFSFRVPLTLLTVTLSMLGSDLWGFIFSPAQTAEKKASQLHEQWNEVAQGIFSDTNALRAQHAIPPEILHNTGEILLEIRARTGEDKFVVKGTSHAIDKKNLLRLLAHSARKKQVKGLKVTDHGVYLTSKAKLPQAKFADFKQYLHGKCKTFVNKKHDSDKVLQKLNRLFRPNSKNNETWWRKEMFVDEGDGITVKYSLVSEKREQLSEHTDAWLGKLKAQRIPVEYKKNSDDGLCEQLNIYNIPKDFDLPSLTPTPSPTQHASSSLSNEDRRELRTHQARVSELVSSVGFQRRTVTKTKGNQREGEELCLQEEKSLPPRPSRQIYTWKYQGKTYIYDSNDPKCGIVPVEGTRQSGTYYVLGYLPENLCEQLNDAPQLRSTFQAKLETARLVSRKEQGICFQSRGKGEGFFFKARLGHQDERVIFDEVVNEDGQHLLIPDKILNHKEIQRSFSRR